MEKNYKKMLSILCLGLISVSAFAQGTWKTTGTETAISASTAITTGITGITLMHSDAATVIGKSDTGATPVTYNSVTWDNLAMIQGSTNGMYYAARTTSNGILDVSVKMGSAKATFVLELTDACPDNADIAALTTNTASGSTIYGTTTYFVLPSVYDTYNNTTGTWNGSAAIQSSGSNQYMVMSFPVSANKTYVFGVNGSKLMLRGLNFKVTTAVAPVNSDLKIFSFQNPAKGNVILQLKESVQIGIYNTVGALMLQKMVTPSENNVDLSGLKSGVYLIKDMNNTYKTQKLIVE